MNKLRQIVRIKINEIEVETMVDENGIQRFVGNALIQHLIKGNQINLDIVELDFKKGVVSLQDFMELIIWAGTPITRFNELFGKDSEYGKDFKIHVENPLEKQLELLPSQKKFAEWFSKNFKEFTSGIYHDDDCSIKTVYFSLGDKNPYEGGTAVYVSTEKNLVYVDRNKFAPEHDNEDTMFFRMIWAMCRMKISKPGDTPSALMEADMIAARHYVTTGRSLKSLQLAFYYSSTMSKVRKQAIEQFIENYIPKKNEASNWIKEPD